MSVTLSRLLLISVTKEDTYTRVAAAMVATPILGMVTEAMACMATATTMATQAATAAVTSMAPITLVAPPMVLATLPTATVIMEE